MNSPMQRWRHWHRVVTVTCVAITAVACSSSPTGAGTEGAPTISGSLDDWQAAVCRPGMPTGPSPTPGTISGTVCHPRIGTTYINFDQFESEYDMNTMLSYSDTNYSAKTTVGGHPFVIWVPASADGRELAPLERFGFTVHPQQSSSQSAAPSTSYPRPAYSSPAPPRRAPAPETAGTPSESGTVVTATTRLQWSGSPCINILSARRDDRTQTGEDRICSDDGTWRYTEQARSGQLIGGDPIMGDAEWISCQLYLGDRLEYSDRAEAGDGTDVNCLRTVN